jgi:hypothetical protein
LGLNAIAGWTTEELSPMPTPKLLRATATLAVLQRSRFAAEALPVRIAARGPRIAGDPELPPLRRLRQPPLVAADGRGAVEGRPAPSTRGAAARAPCSRSHAPRRGGVPRRRAPHAAADRSLRRRQAGNRFAGVPSALGKGSGNVRCRAQGVARRRLRPAARHRRQASPRGPPQRRRLGTGARAHASWRSWHLGPGPRM